MLKRHRRSGFLPNMWVFPGGRVDPEDNLQHLRSPYTDTSFRVAGIRETFEESGIWLGTRPPPAATRAPLNRGEVRFAELLSVHQSTLALDQLVPWSWWVTPEPEPKRYDTRFYVAQTTEEGVHDDVETVDSRWVCPAEAVQKASLSGPFALAPPTWWTLREIAAYRSVQQVFDAASAREIRPILPIRQQQHNRVNILLPGHPDHPEHTLEGLPHSITLQDDRWVAAGDPVTLR